MLEELNFILFIGATFIGNPESTEANRNSNPHFWANIMQ